jgi:hypothetical protein
MLTRTTCACPRADSRLMRPARKQLGLGPSETFMQPKANSLRVFSNELDKIIGPLFCPGWGVVQLVGHLTVNEDGVGSSPTAPAKFSRFAFDASWPV